MKAYKTFTVFSINKRGSDEAITGRLDSLSSILSAQNPAGCTVKAPCLPKTSFNYAAKIHLGKVYSQILMKHYTIDEDYMIYFLIVKKVLSSEDF